MDENEKRIRRKLRDDFCHYALKCLKIRSKTGEIKPFILNKAQGFIHDTVEHQRLATGKVRAIVLKGRQQGCSTYIEGRYFWRVTHNFGLRAFILTHDIEATNNMFEMAQRYYEHCPSIVRPSIEASNAKELIFAGLDSGYKLGTAGNKAVGRSSTIQLLHGSEVAYWPNAVEHAKGILQAVPNQANTEIFIESTAAGIGNYFHQQWQLAVAGLSDFIPIFVPWFWQNEYKLPINKDFELSEEEKHLLSIYPMSLENIAWRRSKVIELSVAGIDGNKSFCQEYPNTPREAFVMSETDVLIPPEPVELARKAKVEALGRLVIGVDCATSGNDRTAIIRRRTRKVYNLQTFTKKTPTEIANIIHRIIIEEQPNLVVIDGSPAGGGSEVRDRLWQLGHKEIVKSVLGGNTPLDQKKYFNKRAEMWGTMKEAIMDIPFEIPDSDELEADLCSVFLDRRDPHDRIKLEKKEEMFKRGIRSPDCADALALTFAFPDSAFTENKKQEDKEKAKLIYAQKNRLDKLKSSAYKG
jgi:hypothetical protein